MPKASLLVFLLAFGAVSVLVDAQEAAEKSDAAAAKKKLHSQLLGAWVLAGTPGEETEPQPGGRMVFFGHKHFTITESDPNTGLVLWNHGGTYKLAGNVYTEKLTYATESTKELIGQQFKFKLKIDGDKLIKMGEGNPWNEVWKRAK